MAMLKNPRRALEMTKTAGECFQMMLVAATKRQHQVGIGQVEFVESAELEWIADMLIEMVGGYVAQQPVKEQERKRPVPGENIVYCIDFAAFEKAVNKE